MRRSAGWPPLTGTCFSRRSIVIGRTSVTRFAGKRPEGLTMMPLRQGRWLDVHHVSRHTAAPFHVEQSQHLVLHLVQHQVQHMACRVRVQQPDARHHPDCCGISAGYRQSWVDILKEGAHIMYLTQRTTIIWFPAAEGLCCNPTWNGCVHSRITAIHIRFRFK